MVCHPQISGVEISVDMIGVSKGATSFLPDLTPIFLGTQQIFFFAVYLALYRSSR